MLRVVALYLGIVMYQYWLVVLLLSICCVSAFRGGHLEMFTLVGSGDTSAIYALIGV